MITDTKKDLDWRAPNVENHSLDFIVEDIRNIGYTVIENAVNMDLIAEAEFRLYDAQQKILADIGKDRLDRAGEIGVLRLIMKYDPFFIQFLELPIIQRIVDLTISETAILHLQNGFINPPIFNNTNNIFQYQFHRDFPRILNGYVASINLFVSVSEFTKENGATLVIPGSHQKNQSLSDSYLNKKSIAIECPPGSLIIFDSTLFHAAGKNITDKDRLGINLQFTRSYIKQQIDYVRALGNDLIEAQQPRVQQLLGYYTRVVTSLDEYYRSENERFYRKGQG